VDDGALSYRGEGQQEERVGQIGGNGKICNECHDVMALPGSLRVVESRTARLQIPAKFRSRTLFRN
jgi:hypothetical protein